MPINLNRTTNIDRTLGRLSYNKGLHIKEDVVNYLSAQPQYYFCADTLSARIETSAHPVQIESVLSRHPEEFTHTKHNGNIYWQLKND